MTDILLEIAKNRNVRAIVQAMGLPLPLPQTLERSLGPSVARPLDGKRLLIASIGASTFTEHVAGTIDRCGGEPFLATTPVESVASGVAPSAATLTEHARIDGIVVDAASMSTIDESRELRAQLQPWMRRMQTCARIVVIGATPRARHTSAEHASVQQALDGFTRSLAKEVGARGATANLIRVADAARARLDGTLTFLLTARAAFVTAQTFDISNKARNLDDAPVHPPLTGTTAIVTGAARGIGEATARRLAVDGAHVICVDRPDELDTIDALATAIQGSSLAVDVTDSDAADQIAQAAAARGGVHIVVHNAGVTRDRKLANMNEERWDLVMDVNLRAVIAMHEALDGRGLIHDGGRVVLLSSVSGVAGNMGQTNYGASKAGVIGLARYEAARLASRGITVNAVAPGFIETQMTARMPMAIREGARRLSALGQGGHPEDVAAMVAFLASRASQGLTGQTIRVCGGALVGA